MAKEKDIKEKNGKKVYPKKKQTNKKQKEKFMTAVKKELKVVKWPTVKEIVKYTIATILFCVVCVLFFEILNIIMAYVKGLFN